MGKKLAKGADTPEGIEARIGEIERKLDRLRGLYESFFMGIERVPPNVARRETNRLILEMQQEPIANASLRFRFQTILQRWVLMTAYWNRTLREIEAGTYRRDLARAQRHLAQKGGVLSEQEAINLGIPAGRAKAFVERQRRMSERRSDKPVAAAAVTAAPTVAAAPPPASVPGIRDGDIEKVYRRYLEEHSRVKDPRPVLPLEKLRERLRVQAPKVLAAGSGFNRIALDVAVEDGKVRLRALPVKD